MTSLRLVLISATFLPSLWAEQGPASSLDLNKRLSINMMDPFTRRSALDKNFLRFGRSGGGINVNREGRARPDSFVRFGRGEDDDEELDNILPDRDIRGKTDFIRFGRGKDNTNSGFIRFGRGKNDNFVRFGRARQDSFIRFGKSLDGYLEPRQEESDFQRVARGVGKSNTNFVRFGKRDPENDEEVINAYKNGLNLNLDAMRNENLARIARLSTKNRGDSFIRFGRTPIFDDDDDDEYRKRFTTSFRELTELGNKLEKHPQPPEYDQTYSDNNPSSDLYSDIDSRKLPSTSRHESSENFTPFDTSLHEINRNKRSVLVKDDKHVSTDSPNSTPFYNYPSQLAADLPNFIIGPELSVLPAHSKSRNSGKKLDENFIRLG